MGRIYSQWQERVNVNGNSEDQGPPECAAPLWTYREGNTGVEALLPFALQVRPRWRYC